jgi:hypothetical protein
LPHEQRLPCGRRRIENKAIAQTLTSREQVLLWMAPVAGAVVFWHGTFSLKSLYREKVAGLIPALSSVTIFKNGLRMVTVSWFSGHPNLHFLTGLLHKYGGIPFSFLVFSGPAFLVMWLSQSYNLYMERTLWQIGGSFR